MSSPSKDLTPWKTQEEQVRGNELDECSAEEDHQTGIAGQVLAYIRSTKKESEENIKPKTIVGQHNE